MNWAKMQSIHRRLGISLAAFLLVQAVAGLLMSMGRLARVDTSGPYIALYSAHAGWDPFGSSYRVLLGLATATQVVLGIGIFLSGVRFRKRTDASFPLPDQPHAAEKKVCVHALSFAADIRPLFRSHDIESMIPLGMNLSSYEDVRKHAQEIYATLSNKSMPCDDPWSDDHTRRFRDWMESGMEP